MPLATEDSTLSLKVAGTRLDLAFIGGGWGFAEKRYKGFLAKGRAAFTLRVRPAGWKQSPFRPKVSEKGGLLRLERGDFSCAVDLRTGRGELACAQREQTLDSFLRTFYSWLLPRQGGMLLHAAGFVKKRRAFIFPGKSGAGKSTLSKLAAAAGLDLLSDELVPVLPLRGGYAAYGSPFWGEMRRPGADGRFALHGVYALRKAGRDAVEPMAAGEMLRLLLRCSMNFSADTAAARRLLDSSAGLAAAKTAGRLSFIKGSPGCIDLL